MPHGCLGFVERFQAQVDPEADKARGPCCIGYRTVGRTLPARREREGEREEASKRGELTTKHTKGTKGEGKTAHGTHGRRGGGEGKLTTNHTNDTNGEGEGMGREGREGTPNAERSMSNVQEWRSTGVDGSRQGSIGDDGKGEGEVNHEAHEGTRRGGLRTLDSELRTLNSVCVKPVRVGPCASVCVRVWSAAGRVVAAPGGGLPRRGPTRAGRPCHFQARRPCHSGEGGGRGQGGRRRPRRGRARRSGGLCVWSRWSVVGSPVVPQSRGPVSPWRTTGRGFGGGGRCRAGTTARR